MTKLYEWKCIPFTNSNDLNFLQSPLENIQEKSYENRDSIANEKDSKVLSIEAQNIKFGSDESQSIANSLDSQSQLENIHKETESEMLPSNEAQNIKVGCQESDESQSIANSQNCDNFPIIEDLDFSIFEPQEKLEMDLMPAEFYSFSCDPLLQSPVQDNNESDTKIFESSEDSEISNELTDLPFVDLYSKTLAISQGPDVESAVGAVTALNPGRKIVPVPFQEAWIPWKNENALIRALQDKFGMKMVSDTLVSAWKDAKLRLSEENVALAVVSRLCSPENMNIYQNSPIKDAILEFITTCSLIQVEIDVNNHAGTCLGCNLVFASSLDSLTFHGCKSIAQEPSLNVLLPVQKYLTFERSKRQEYNLTSVKCNDCSHICSPIEFLVHNCIEYFEKNVEYIDSSVFDFGSSIKLENELLDENRSIHAQSPIEEKFLENYDSLEKTDENVVITTELVNLQKNGNSSTSTDQRTHSPSFFKQQVRSRSISPSPSESQFTNQDLTKIQQEHEFCCACDAGDLKQVSMLLNNPDFSWSPDGIIVAAQRGHEHIVSWLLKDGRIDPASQSNRALHFAMDFAGFAKGNNRKHLQVIISLLQDYRVNPSSSDNNVFIKACRLGLTSIVKNLLKDLRIDPSKPDNEAIIEACSNGHLLVVQELLKDNRVNVTARNNEAFLSAARNGHTSILMELLDYTDFDIDAGYKEDEALMLACANGHSETVKYLLQHPEVNPSSRGSQALILAIKGNHEEIVHSLLSTSRAISRKKTFSSLLGNGKRNSNIDAATNNNLPIILASKLGCLNIVKLLLRERRVDPAAENNLAIINASQFGHADIVEVLLNQKGVNPAAQDNNALSAACFNGHFEVVKLLLDDKRVDPSLNNNDPFIFACMNGNIDIVDYLLMNPQVNPSARDNEGLIHASERGHFRVVARILKHSQLIPNGQISEAKRKAALNSHVAVVKLLDQELRMRERAVELDKGIIGRSNSRRFSIRRVSVNISNK